MQSILIETPEKVAISYTGNQFGDEKVSQPSSHQSGAESHNSQGKKAGLLSELYLGNTAQYCRGGCGKFRYPKCIWNGEPICVSCSFYLGLQIANPVSSPIRKESVRVVRPKQDRKLKVIPKPKRYLRLVDLQLQLLLVSHALLLINQSLLRAILRAWYGFFKTGKGKKAETCKLSTRFLQALIWGPKSSTDLSNTLDTHLYYLSEIGRELIAQGKVVRMRQISSHHHCYWYALSHHQERLWEATGNNHSLIGQIHAILADGPRSLDEVDRQIKNYPRASIGTMMSRMAKKGKLITRGHNNTRRYALPKDEELLIQTAIHLPIRDAILKLLQEEPGLWQQEISRKLSDFCRRTVINNLNELEELGVIKGKMSDQGWKHYELTFFSIHPCNVPDQL